MNISNHFVGKLSAGQADIENLTGSQLARIEYDGSTWFYDMPEGTTLEEFKVAAEVAWGRDCAYAEIWGSDGFARVSFD